MKTNITLVKKKGQAALEFLMTYGWAILVVMIVIAALGYFGFLNPDIFTTSRCALAGEVSCHDYNLRPTTASFSIKNNLNVPIYINNLTVNSSTAGVNGNCRGEPNITVSPNAVGTATGNCITILNAGGRKGKYNFYVSYYRTDSSAAFTHTEKGEIIAPIRD